MPDQYQLANEEREALEEAAHADEDKLDNAILQLSAGALAVCIAFVRPTVTPETRSPALFSAAVALFIACLLTAVWSLHIGAQAKWAAIRVRGAGSTKGSRADLVLRVLNLASPILFTAGLIALAVFVGANAVGVSL